MVNKNKVDIEEISAQAHYMSMQKQITESQKAIGCYAKAIEDKQLDKINTYTNMLMDSRKEDKPDPQWLLDALGMLGVPYMTLGQTANIMNRTVLSTEKFKEAKAKLQTTMDDLQSRLFSKENIEKLQNLWENSLKQYETQRTLSLENLQKRLEECEFEPLTEEEIAFYNDLPNILSELGTKLPPDKQANLLSCLHIKGNVEAIDLKRFGLTAENGVDESTLEELSKAITLKYDANYYINLEAEKKAQEDKLWYEFWEGVASHPLIHFGNTVAQEGGRLATFLGEEGHLLMVEAPKMLYGIGHSWIQLQG